MGHAAQASGSGTAYCLLAPDGVPYLLLGHAFTLTLEEPSGTVGVDSVLGRVLQSVVDDEDCGLGNTLEALLELLDLERLANNAQQQYVCGAQRLHHIP